MPEFFLSTLNLTAEVLLDLVKKASYDEIIRFPVDLSVINSKFFQVNETILACDNLLTLTIYVILLGVKVVSSQQTLQLTALNYQKQLQNITVNDELDNEEVWKFNFNNIVTAALNDQKEYLDSIQFEHFTNNLETNPTMLVTDDGKVKYFPLDDPKNLCSTINNKWKTLNRSRTSGTLPNGKNVEFLLFADGDIFSHILSIRFPNFITPRKFKIEAVVHDSVNNPKLFPTIQAADISKCIFSPLKSGNMMIVPIDLTKSGTALNDYSSNQRYTRQSTNLQTELASLNTYFNTFDLFFFPYVSTINSNISDQRVIILNTSLTNPNILQFRENDMFPMMSFTQYSSKYKGSYYIQSNVAISFPIPSFQLGGLSYSEGGNVSQANSESDFYNGTFLTSDQKIVVSKQLPFFHASYIPNNFLGFDLYYHYNAKKIVSKPQTDITFQPASVSNAPFIVYKITEATFAHPIQFIKGDKSFQLNEGLTMNNFVTGFNAAFIEVARAIFVDTSHFLLFMMDGSSPVTPFSVFFNTNVGSITIKYTGFVNYVQGTNYATPLLPVFDFTLTANVSLTKTFGTNRFLVAEEGLQTVDELVSMVNSFNTYLVGLNEGLSWNVKASVRTDVRNNKYLFLENRTESFTVSTEFPLLYEYLGFNSTSASVNLPESVTFKNHQNVDVSLEAIRATVSAM